MQSPVDSEGHSTFSKLRTPWSAWLCAAPMPIIGIAVGHYVSMELCRQAAEAARAESPEGYVCGLIVIPYLFVGLVGGAIFGILLGALVATLVTRLANRGNCAHGGKA